MRPQLIATLCLIGAAPVSAVLAADAPPPPPENVWLGKGALGFVDTSGNSSAEALNAALTMDYYAAPWQHEFFLGGLYGKSGNVVSAENYEAKWQSNYSFTPRMFGFGALRYDHDLFSGFHYQESVAVGVGYKIIDTTDTKLTGQIGVGYRKMELELITPDPIIPNAIDRSDIGTKSGAIVTLGVDYAQQLTTTTKLTDVLAVESGAGDTLIKDTLALNVAISKAMSLSLGYTYQDNTTPPMGRKKVDTIAMANLVYSF